MVELASSRRLRLSPSIAKPTAPRHIPRRIEDKKPKSTHRQPCHLPVVLLNVITYHKPESASSPARNQREVPATAETEDSPVLFTQTPNFATPSNCSLSPFGWRQQRDEYGIGKGLEGFWKLRWQPAQAWQKYRIEVSILAHILIII